MSAWWDNLGWLIREATEEGVELPEAVERFVACWLELDEEDRMTEATR